MYKNVSLRRRTLNGKPTWLLLGPDARPVDAFDAFAHSLRNGPKNTLDSYCRHLAEFMDYLIEVSVVVAPGRHLTKLELAEAVEAYGDYLAMGADATNDLARLVAAHLPPGKNASATLVTKKAAVRRFLNLSEEVRKELAELALLRGDATVVPIDGDPLLPGLGQRRELKPYEVRAMEANSMLAGVIADGPKLVQSVVLGGPTADTSYDERRAFPYDKVMELIDAMPTHRDKAQYALLAASGCRTHEGLQMLIEDMDVVDGTVRLVDPTSRQSHLSYRYLAPDDRAKLAWKGRTTEITLLIEPFASTFFEALQKYLELEHIPHGKHDFVFQYLSGAERGMPYFLSEASTRVERFHKVCRHVGVTLPPGTGPHSLRHMYGTYLLNYFPRANGDYGLPVPMVQQLMGHADQKSTLKYARYDKDLLKLEIQNANRVLFRHGTPKNLLELKLEVLESQIAKIRAQLKLEVISHG